MTKSKREPFATYRPYSRGLMADGFVDGKQYAYLSVAEAKHQIQTINAAFNARVDEEVRKAVEKFRERAEIVVRQECGGKCGGDRGCEISRKIMEIPTEPEVK